MKEKKTLIIFVAVMAILITSSIVAFCIFTPKKEAGDKDFVQKKDKLTIALGMEPLNALAIIADSKDFFHEEGLDVVIKEYPSGKRALNEGLLAGEADIATTASTPFVFQSFERDDFSAIATIGSSNNEIRVIANRDRGIAKPQDVRGKRIATQKASSVHFFLHLFMVKNGLSDGDAKLSFMRAEKLPMALASGEIDAFSMREPFISRAGKLIGDKAIVFAEPGLFIKKYNIVALNKLIKNKPDVIASVIRAVVKAEKVMQNNFNEAVEIVSKRLKVDESKISNVLPLIDYRVSLDQSLFNIFEDIAKWAIKYNFTNKTEPPNYLNYIYIDGIKNVAPESLTIIH